jgi:hypothetical protein
MARKFVVAANHKMFVLRIWHNITQVVIDKEFRNGTITSIKKITQMLNEAKLDPQAG